ncbi:hypothetical protein DV515_00016221, partial [Chloebia gouldiae]
EASNAGPGKRLAEEEDALAAAQLEEDALALDSKSAQALARKEAKRLVVAKGETSEQSPEEEAPDSEGVVVETLSDQSSKRSQGLEASSGEAAEKGAGRIIPCFFGKVVGAKVVTNARSPGARCYGFEATKCITHLHKTELHGKIISVEKVIPTRLCK